MADIPFSTLDDVRYGVCEVVSPLIRRVIADNPSKFAYRGTGTYIVGQGDVAVVDPGPELDSHREALAAALAGERVVAILVTHCHSDHSPLSAWLRAETGAPTVAFGPHLTPPDPDEAVSDEVKEPVDRDFVPDVSVGTGDVVASGRGWTMRAVHTPGHTANHTCYTLEEESALFTGDHIMGWSTTVVSPPDGDMRAYVDSLRAVRGRGDAVLWPTHGPPVRDPGPFLDAYLAHRLEREAQVLAAVRAGRTTPEEIVADLYTEVDPGLHRAAARSVRAHLLKLRDDGLVAFDGSVWSSELDLSARRTADRDANGRRS